MDNNKNHNSYDNFIQKILNEMPAFVTDNHINNDEPKDDRIEDDEINIDDYVLAEEELEFGSFINLINIYTCYFKQVFERKQNTPGISTF